MNINIRSIIAVAVLVVVLYFSWGYFEKDIGKYAPPPIQLPEGMTQQQMEMMLMMGRYSEIPEGVTEEQVKMMMTGVYPRMPGMPATTTLSRSFVP